MAETSLARQLRKLRTPQAQQLRQVHGRDSFLYGYREASAITCDAHHALANAGFEDLCRIDDYIKQYHELFTEASKDFERSIQTTEVNENLDTELDGLLFQSITPYFLLTPSHRILEWLIYKYRVNEYNTDSLIFATLPYHETKLFSRVVQICRSAREPTSKWHWLMPMAAAGEVLPKSTIINQFSRNTDLLDKLFHYVDRFDTASHAIYTSFATAIGVGVINNGLTDAILNSTLLFVTRGFKSTSPSRVASSYALYSFMAVKAHDSDCILTESVSSKVMIRALRHFKKYPFAAEIEDVFIKFLSVVCKNSGQRALQLEVVQKIPESLLVKLDRSAEPLISQICICLLRNLNEENYGTLMNLLNNTPSYSIAWDCLVDLAENPQKPSVWLSNFFNHIDEHFPLQLEQFYSRSGRAQMKQILPSELYKKYKELERKRKSIKQVPAANKRKFEPKEDDKAAASEEAVVYNLKDICTIQSLQSLPHITFDDKTDCLIRKIFQTTLSERAKLEVSNILKPAWFESIADRKIQISIIAALLESYRSSAWRRKLKKFATNGEIIVAVIDKLSCSDNLAEEHSRRSRRRSRRRLSFDGNASHWQQVMILLEQTSQTLTNSGTLMQTCFTLLRESFLQTDDGSLEYFRKLLISVIAASVDQADLTDLKHFDIHTLFDCLKYLKKRETQREAISLIVKVSGHFKQELVQNIVNIFGFITTSMLQYDDTFTAKLIDESFKMLLPCVCDNLEVNDLIIDIFIDALADIPSHRQLLVFQKLLSIAGNDSLWYASVKFVERQAQKKEADSKFENHSTFVIKLLLISDTEVLLPTLTKLLKAALWFHGSNETMLNRRTFPIAGAERKEAADLLVSILASVFSNDSFVEIISKYQWEKARSHFQTFIQELMLTINKSTEKSKSNQSAGFNRALYGLLGHVNNLLPDLDMIELLTSLLASKDTAVKKVAVQLLNAKLSRQVGGVDAGSLISLLQPLKEVFRSGSEGKLIEQHTLLSFKLLAKCFHKNEQCIEALEDLMGFSLNLLEDEKRLTHLPFVASTIIAITQIALSLENQAIPFWSKIIKNVLKYLSTDSIMLTIATVSCLDKLVKRFAHMFTHDLSSAVAKLCIVESGMQSSSADVIAKIVPTKKHIVRYIPLRTLVGSLEKAYKKLENDEKSLILLCDLYASAFKSSAADKFEEDANFLHKFSFKLLTERAIKTQFEAESPLQNSIVNFVVSFMCKASEGSFKRLFLKLSDWRPLECGSEADVLKLGLFYKLLSELADSVKVLFSILVAPSILEHVVSTLDSLHSRKDLARDNETLVHTTLMNTLLTATKCFLYDENGILATKDRAIPVCSSIINQLTNEMHDQQLYEERVKLGISKCITYMVRSSSDNLAVREVHQKILLQTQENFSRVRLYALRVLHELILSMNEEYMSLLPEAVPFLAELFEDDDDEIHSLLLTLFSDVEQIIGEPITNYF